jgi:hypothetical protein
MGLLAVAFFHDIEAFVDIERLSNVVVGENQGHFASALDF